jgi:hypothetical protein
MCPNKAQDLQRIEYFLWNKPEVSPADIEKHMLRYKLRSIKRISKSLGFHWNKEKKIWENENKDIWEKEGEKYGEF